MLNSLRPYLTKFLEPLASSAYFFATGNLIGGALFILLSGFLDVVDGAVARYHDRASPFGAFLDSTMDRFADAIIFIGIIFGGYCHWFVGVLAIHSAITVSYVRARAESQGVECNIGIAERAVRMIILMLGAVIAAIFHSNIIFTYLHVWKELNGPRKYRQKRLR